MRIRPILRYAGVLLSLGACIEDDGDRDRDARARGEFGAGDFAYDCVNDTDLTCTDGGSGFPRALAVGSRFDLRFTVDEGPLPTVIAPANNDFVRPIEGGFQVRRAGEFALLAVNGNREVIDIKHLRAADVSEVRVQPEDGELPVTTLRLDLGRAVRLSAVPYGASGVQLGGALSYGWSSSDDSLVSIDSLSALNRVNVRAGRKAGKAELAIDVGGQTFTVQVEVGQATAGAQDAGVLADGAAPNADAASEGGAP